jgi:hypothetical protein
MRKLPAKFELPLFALLLSGLMSFIVSGVALMRNLGAIPTPALWLNAWLSSWLVAFPSVILIAPLVRKLVTRWVEPKL